VEPKAATQTWHKYLFPELTESVVGLAEDVEVRVWDSTAELRYLVLPERPEGTGG
jgi:hypothetical protein